MTRWKIETIEDGAVIDTRYVFAENNCVMSACLHARGFLRGAGSTDHWAIGSVTEAPFWYEEGNRRLEAWPIALVEDRHIYVMPSCSVLINRNTTSSASVVRATTSDSEGCGKECATAKESKQRKDV